MTPQVNAIDQQAAEWAAKGTDLSIQEQAALDAWLDADQRNLGAFLKANAVLVRVDRARHVPVEDRAPASALSRRRLLLVGSIAASLAVVAVGIDRFWDRIHEDVYATELGETKVIGLSDGSQITLNTSSKAIVRYTADRRGITLVQGEALFDVAKNKKRAFVVALRGIEVRAVGTSFSVLSLPDRPLEVQVREGVVRIDRPHMRSIVLPANGRAVITADGSVAVETLTPTMIAQYLAWQSGHIFLQNRTLASAAQEFARYSRTRIILDDPTVANSTVTGLYQASDPVGFAKAAAVSLDLNVEMKDHEVRLSRKNS